MKKRFANNSPTTHYSSRIFINNNKKETLDISRVSEMEHSGLEPLTSTLPV